MVNDSSNSDNAVEPRHKNSLSSEADKRLEDFRQQIASARFKLTENFDKQLLTFSAGALGLSVSFVATNIGFSNWLFLAWISFGLAIGFTLMLHHFAIAALQHQYDETCRDFQTEKPLNECKNENDSKLDKSTIFQTFEMTSRYAASIAFCFGVIFLVLALVVRNG